MNLIMAILTLPACGTAVYVTHWRFSNRRHLTPPDRIGGNAMVCFLWILTALFASFWLQL